MILKGKKLVLDDMGNLPCLWPFVTLTLERYLKVNLHQIFYFCFFSIKSPHSVPWFIPYFVLNIKSKSPRYSNHLSLCVDSVNMELIFSFKLHTNFHHWPHLNISWIIFLYPFPLNALELGIYACFGLFSLLHHESTWSETPRRLSQRGVRLYVNWINAE